MIEGLLAPDSSSAPTAWVLVADDRPSDAGNLDAIRVVLELLGFGVQHAPSIERALALIPARPAAVLVHAGQSHEGASSTGATLAALLLHREPDLPLVLYGRHDSTSSNDTRLARATWTAETSLASSLSGLLPALLDLRRGRRDLAARLRQTTDPVDAVGAIPSGFRIEMLLHEIAGAALLCAVRHHGSMSRAAAALGMAERRARRWFEEHGPRVVEAEVAPTEPGVVWVSRSIPPASVVALGETLGARVRREEPGYARRWSSTADSALAAIIEPASAAAVIDAWALERSVRGLPVVYCGAWSTPTRFLAARLGPTGVGSTDSRGIESLVTQIVTLGRAAARVRAMSAKQEPESLRPRWFLDLELLLRRVEADVLELADGTNESGESAARAVGLPRSTYYFRLNRARRRLGLGARPVANCS